MWKKLETKQTKKWFYCSWNCSIRGWEEFEVESRSVLSLLYYVWVQSILCWVPFGVKSILSFYVESHSEFSPFRVESLLVLRSILCWVTFWVQSVLISVYSRLSPFGVEFIWDWVHLGSSPFGGWVPSGLSPFGVESIRGWVHSGFSPIWGWVHSDKSPILNQSF